MAKTFFTERDIEDMTARGERTLIVTNDVVLTDLAYESARKLNVELVQPNDTPPGAPVRPYLNTAPASAASPLGLPSSARLEDIKQRVKSAVRARLDSQVDEAMLNRIIERVAADLGLR